MKFLSIILILLLAVGGCCAEECAELPDVTAITDAASFASACTALDESCVFTEVPAGIVLDDAAFGRLITEGSGVAFIADPADPACRLLAPVLFAQMAANNSVIQLYLPDDPADCDGLMKRVIEGGISITGNKPLAESLAESGELPLGAVLYMKEGKITAMHMATLKNHEELPAALTEEDSASITDMLQFQLDKLLSGSCETGC